MKFETLEERLIWLKGDLVHANEAMIMVLSPTSQFGLNVFEGIPCYWNDEEKQLYAFRLDDHYNRLLRSAKLIEFNCPYTKEQMKEALVSVVKANEYDENLSVRQTLFADGFGSWGSAEPIDMFVAPIPRGKTSAEYNKKGLNVCVTSWRRISENALSPRIKCGANYINSRYGQREALRNGYDTCIFLNEYGKVAEGPGSCFFMVKNNILITPSFTDAVLESITRDSLITIAKDQGFEVQERTIHSIDEIHIGLNDLHISYGLSFMFELLTNGTVERIIEMIKPTGKPYGFGGIAKIGDGAVPAEMVILEHYRLGSTRAILSRTFCDNAKIDGIDEIDRVFNENMKKLREYEDYAANASSSTYEENRKELNNRVADVVQQMKDKHENCAG